MKIFEDLRFQLWSQDEKLHIKDVVYGIDEEPNPAFTVDASAAVKFAYVSEIEILGICEALAALSTESAWETVRSVKLASLDNTLASSENLSTTEGKLEDEKEVEDCCVPDTKDSASPIFETVA